MSAGRTTTVDIDPALVEQQLAADSQRLHHAADGLCATGRDFHRRGWSLGTSSNYSVVLGRDPLELLLTASGKDKGGLGAEDFVRVDGQGKVVHHRGDSFPLENRPSAETMLHVVLARLPDVGAVLHTHSVWGTILSQQHFPAGGIELREYEMLKGLAGITTHETSKWLPIFDNTQDIDALAASVEERLLDPREPLQHGFLIRGHGLYTWGRDLAEARRHVEVFEFLLECEGRKST